MMGNQFIEVNTVAFFIYMIIFSAKWVGFDEHQCLHLESS